MPYPSAREMHLESDLRSAQDQLVQVTARTHQLETRLQLAANEASYWKGLYEELHHAHQALLRERPKRT